MSDRDPGPFADVLNKLIASSVDAQGKQWTNASLAAACRDLGVPVAREYVSMLRSGARANPTLDVMRALAQVLGVTLAALDVSEGSQRVRDALALQRAMDEQGIAGIALRAQVLSPQALQNVASFIEMARSMEGHPDDRPSETAE